MDAIIEREVKRGLIRKSKVGKTGYDLTLDRRVSNRRDSLNPELEGMQFFERRRCDERRQDNRPLNEFPFLPEAIL